MLLIARCIPVRFSVFNVAVLRYCQHLRSVIFSSTGFNGSFSRKTVCCIRIFERILHFLALAIASTVVDPCYNALYLDLDSTKAWDCLLMHMKLFQNFKKH